MLLTLIQSPNPGTMERLPKDVAEWTNQRIMDLASRRENETNGLAHAAVRMLRQRGLDDAALQQLAVQCVRHRIQRTHVLSVAEPDPHLRLPRNPLLTRPEIVRIFEEEEARLDGPPDDPLFDSSTEESGEQVAWLR